MLKLSNILHQSFFSSMKYTLLSLFYTTFSFLFILYWPVPLLIIYFKPSWNHFVSIFRISFSKSLLVVNSFDFCLIVLFIALLFLKDIFYVCMFSFSTMMTIFRKLHCCHWDINCQSNSCEVFWVFLEIISLFSLTAFKFL